MKDYPVEYIDLKTGEKIAYRKAGKGDQTFILVHGNMSSSVHMQPLMEKLEEDFTVYAIDLAGFGDSSYNRQLDSLYDFSQDLTNFIKDLDLRNIHLLGWSTGGGVVLETAADVPKRVKKVFLLSSVGIKGYPMYKKDATFQPILSERIYKREDVAADPVQVLPVVRALEAKNAIFMKTLWDTTIYTRVRPSYSDYKKYLEAMLKQRNLVDVDVALTTFNMTDSSNGVVDGSGRINKITAPVVILHGERDIVVPIKFAEETKEAFGSQASLIEFKGLGHSIITDDLEALTKAIYENL